MTAELSGMVSTIQKFSLDDGPGIRTTVFLKGCQLKCPWCHNPETQLYYPEIYYRATQCINCGKCAEVCPVESAIILDSKERINRQLCNQCMKCTTVCPTGALETVGNIMTVTEVMNEVMGDAIFYETSGGGVTFSGGEPTVQVLFLEALLKRSKELCLHTCIETNGYTSIEVWHKLIPYLDLVLFDIKHLDPVIHKNFIGTDNDIILQSALQLAGQIDMIIRTPLIPGFNDSEEFIAQLGQFVSSLPNVNECHLIPYHEYGSSKYVMLGRKADLYQVQNPLGDRPQHYKEILEKYGLNVKVIK